jgi:hypothetical protein
MEKAVFISNSKQLNRIENFDRVYYGSEFCQNLIPTLDNLKIIFSATKNKKKLTLLTPYVTGCGLEKLKPLFQYLSKQNSRTEVVFNDWGVFKLIREGYRNIEPVLGRLLTKQRRDPRIYNILLNKQKPTRIFDKKSKKTFVFIPKETPLSLYEHFKGSVINVPVFQEFLLANNIRRVEIDNLAWDMKIEVNKRIGVSIYLPYAYVTTTRLCGLINLTYSACGRECQKYYFSFKNDVSPLPFYIWGNTIFYKSKIPKEGYLKERSVDRIIDNSNTPIEMAEEHTIASRSL